MEIDQKDARTMRRYLRAMQAAMTDYLDPANRQKPARFADTMLELLDDQRLVRAVEGRRKIR